MHRAKTGNFAFSVFNSNITKWILRHFYVVLLIPIFLYSSPLFQNGISIAGDFPYLDTPHYSADKLWMWVDKGSRDGFEFLARYSIISIWYGLNFLHFGSDLATKVMVISGFFLSSFCFYFSFLRFFKIKHIDSNLALKLSAVVGSLFYTYNVWSFNRIHHWYLWIGYTILPLFILSIYYSFRNPKNWKYIVLSTLLWSFASITAHMVIFYGIILACTFFGFVINDLYTRKGNVTKLVIPLILIVSCYALVNMYWIYPYGVASQIRVPNPPYELTKESLELLSRESTFLNSFRIMAYWLNTGVDASGNQFYSSLWTITTFVVPVTAFSALMIRRSIKFALIFAAASLISIFLTMGTRSPINYYDLALNFPIVSKFVWVFRDPEKWAFIAIFAFSFMIGIVSYKLLRLISKEHCDKKKIIVVGSFMVFLMASIFFSSYPFYSARMDPLKPVQLPSEFDKLNEYLNTINTDKVYFIPYPMKETDWDKNGVVQNIYNAHSIKPSIDSSEYYPMASTYYNYLVNTIMENRSNGISNLINPLGTSYVIFHNDSWNKLRDKYDVASIEFLNKFHQIRDVKNINDIGFYNIFRTSNNNSSESIRQLDIPHQSIGVIGGLDIFGSLESIPTFSSKRSSLLFLDDIRPVNKNSLVNGFNDLLLDRSPSDDEFALSFLDRRYVLTPFDHTISNDPTKVWSKSGARDPIHGAFHPDLKRLRIENWDFDYGEGLVKTRAVTNMSIPIEMKDLAGNGSETNDNYHLFMRYFKNQKGGPMKIYLDNKILNEIDGFDKLSNNFVWQEIGSVKLQNERHKLTLENVGGFNAVNIFAIIPETEINKLRSESAELLADKSQIIYLLEAESNFNNIKGKDSTLTQLIDQEQFSNNDTFDKNITGQFKVPKNSDLVSLKFQTNKSQISGNFKVDEIQIRPGQDKYTAFVSDFERTGQSVPLATLRYSDWFNLDKNLVSTSTFVGKAAFGNKSLKVELKPSDGAGWDTITTNFIPITDDAYYNASLHLDARDVKQLHSKILFFDSKQIEFSDSAHYILDGKDGTFNDTFSSIVVPPKGANYIKIQVLARTANPAPSNYVLDSVKFEEIVFPGILKNGADDTFDISTTMDRLDNGKVLQNDSLINDTDYEIETIPYPVKEDHKYDYNIGVTGNNISSYYVRASFGNSDDVSENATRYGNNASNGRVISLDRNSEIHMKLNIIRAANYTIALKASTCDTCTYLTASLASSDKTNKLWNDSLIGNYTLKSNDASLKWVYSNTSFSLMSGVYDLKIYSDSKTDLDIVAIYPSKSSGSNEQNGGFLENNQIENIFAIDNNNSSPAKISEYHKINPTKFILKISNATKPYVISFAESYDPLWQARIDRTEIDDNNSILENNYRINSMPLYGLTNGFYINNTGNYNVILEYSPQVWFGQGLVISIFALATMAVIILLQKTRRRFLKT